VDPSLGIENRIGDSDDSTTLVAMTVGALVTTKSRECLLVSVSKRLWYWVRFSFSRTLGL
jgi:hypothetical protein